MNSNDKEGGFFVCYRGGVLNKRLVVMIVKLVDEVFGGDSPPL